jgi:hypothetical protein
LGCFLLTLAAQALAALAPATWFGHWPSQIVAEQARFLDRFFPFDAVWYSRIATDGYQWDPLHPALMQDVAFFPFWPMVLRIIGLCVAAPEAARLVSILVAAGFGLASIWAMHGLARRLLSAPAAGLATLFFAFYPAACFLLLSYPTGAMNLFVILALLALMRDRLWHAALWACLATSCGPLGLGTALTVSWAALRPLWARQGTARPPELAWGLLRAGAISFVAAGGLIGFMLWQAVRLGDPLAFIAAQRAWETPAALGPHVAQAALQLLILPEFVAALRALKHVAHPPGLVWLELAMEKSVNMAAQGAGMIAILASARLRSTPILLQGGFTMLLFIWFDASLRLGHATTRLTYCIPAIFLGSAWLLRNHRGAAYGVLGVSAALMAVEGFLIAAGHHVV